MTLYSGIRSAISSTPALLATNMNNAITKKLSKTIIYIFSVSNLLSGPAAFICQDCSFLSWNDVSRSHISRVHFHCYCVRIHRQFCITGCNKVPVSGEFEVSDSTFFFCTHPSSILPRSYSILLTTCALIDLVACASTLQTIERSVWPICVLSHYATGEGILSNLMHSAG